MNEIIINYSDRSLAEVPLKDVKTNLGKLSKVENKTLNFVINKFNEKPLIDAEKFKKNIATYINLRTSTDQIESQERNGLYKIAALVCIAVSVAAIFVLTSAVAAGIGFLLGTGIAIPILVGLLAASLGNAYLFQLYKNALESIKSQTENKKIISEEIGTDLNKLNGLVSDKKNINLINDEISKYKNKIDLINKNHPTHGVNEKNKVGKIEAENAKIKELEQARDSFKLISEVLHNL